MFSYSCSCLRSVFFYSRQVLWLLGCSCLPCGVYPNKRTDTLQLEKCHGRYACVSFAVWFAREKIITYYIDGMMNSREMWSRPAMLYTSGQIFCDYFPFGCGLGSFGTFASAEYYSPIYETYGLNHIWGLSKDMPILFATLSIQN